MNTEFFIARKIITGNKNASRLTRPIVFISLFSITAGVAFMIIAVSVITGFQQEIRDKVVGFDAHIRIKSMEYNTSMESTPILIEQDFYPSFEEDERIRKIQVYAYKPAILQSSQDSVNIQLAGKDTVESRNDILGVLFKGVDARYDWQFFEDKMVAGKMIEFHEENDQVMISQYMADVMGYNVGDRLEAFFITDDSGPKKRKFTVCGIYRTGFEEFDKQFIYTQIQHIQALNNWGVQTNITVMDTCIQNYFVLKAMSFNGSGGYRYNWDGGYVENPYFLINGHVSFDLEMTSTDYPIEALYGLSPNANSVPDTARAKITVNKPCSCSEELLAEHPIEYVSENEIIMPFGKIEIENGPGTHHLYTGGFEVMLEDWHDLDETNDYIYNEIPLLDTEKITEVHPEIFKWLQFLDIDMIIIIVMILLVSMINMVTSLLVMILEKTNMIGVLKALGATNKSIRGIFMYNSFFLLSRGLLFGNVLGIGLIVAQHYFQFATLNPDIYYLDSVPVNINIVHILLINLLTIAICLLTLLLPSNIVSRISPVKAIRFN